jgi:hypothetical protein
MSSPIALPMDWLRSLTAGFRPDTAAIMRYVETNTPDGPVQDWQTVASGISCRVSRRPRPGTEGIGASNLLVAVSAWHIFLPFDTDVTEQDRIVVTGSDRVDGRTFEVTTVGEKSYEAERRCECTLVT